MFLDYDHMTRFIFKILNSYRIECQPTIVVFLECIMSGYLSRVGSASNI